MVSVSPGVVTFSPGVVFIRQVSYLFRHIYTVYIYIIYLGAGGHIRVESASLTPTPGPESTCTQVTQPQSNSTQCRSKDRGTHRSTLQCREIFITRIHYFSAEACLKIGMISFTSLCTSTDTSPWAQAWGQWLPWYHSKLAYTHRWIHNQQGIKV